MSTVDDSPVHGRAADYALGRLTSEQELEFQAHVTVCEECAATLKILVHVSETVGPQPKPKVRSRAWWRNLTRPSVPIIAILAVAMIGGILVKVIDKPAAKSTYLYGKAAYKTTHVALKLQNQTAELLTVGLPPAPSGETYEIYVLTVRGSEPLATGTYFEVNDRGEGEAAVPQGTADLREVILYAEPAGASSYEQGTPVVTVTVPAKDR